MGLVGEMRGESEWPCLLRIMLTGETGLVECWPSERIELDLVDRGDCRPELDLEVRRSTSEEQEGWGTIFFCAGFGGDLDVTD